MILQIIFLMYLLWSHGAASGQEQGIRDGEEIFRQAFSLRDIDPDSSLTLYNEALPLFRARKDSARLISTHIGVADVYKNQGQFGAAYDHIWDALLLAEAFKDTVLLLEVHEDVGGLYSILSKYDEAVKHFQQAMDLARYLAQSGDLRPPRLIRIYYSMAVVHRKAGGYSGAMAYLDTCLVLDSKWELGIRDAGYVDAELGRNYLHLKQMELAEEHLYRANSVFSERGQHYEIMTSLFLGDLHAEKESWGQAEQYYSRCLLLIRQYHSHSDVSREALQKLSIAQYKLGKTRDAYTHLNMAFSISDSLYSSNNSVNSDLFQIRNKYADELGEKDLQILEQDAELNKHRLARARARMVGASILMGLLAALVWLRYRSRMHRISLEKQQLKLKSEQELEKAKAVTEAKTRELTASALQMIEKERSIEELLKELEASSSTSYAAMASKVQHTSKNMWQDFNMRFTEVNSDFYTKLRERHPDLTPTELKHCALIKLNFSSKEMADLLNITLNSVHISRHRIRKKIGLERDQNLGNYITDIN